MNLDLETQKNTKRNLVVQSNSLINASYNLTLLEKRIIVFMISQIHQDDEKFQSYRLDIKEFCENLETDSKNLYERVQEHLKRLMTRVVEIQEEDRILLTHFLSSSEYQFGNGYVELCFDPKLKPYLLQLKKCFTAYSLENVLSLKSVYSVRIYELLKQFEVIGERTISVEELKRMFKAQNKYKSYYLFKQRVILKAQEELSALSDISFDFDEIKEGRKVTYLKFKIIKTQKAENEKALMNDPQFVAFQELVDLGIDKKQAMNFVKVKDLQEIRESIDYAKKQYNVKKVHTSLGGYLKTIIENGAQQQAPFEKRQKEEKEKEQRAAEDDRQRVEHLKAEFDDHRRSRIDELVNAMTENEKEDFYQTLPNFQRAIIYDDKGRLKPKMANMILRGQLAKNNKLEDNDETFKEWAFTLKKVVLKKAFRSGGDEWSIESQQARLF